MTYALLNAAFVAVAVVVAALAALAARRRRMLGRALAAGAATLTVLLVFTAVFDNLIIASGLVAYDDAHTSGLRIVLAPLEDFSYTLAAVLLLPSLWVLSDRRALARARGDRRSS